MATEKAIVNTSQSAISLNQGRLLPGGILRVADYFRTPDDVYRDLQVRRYVSSGYLSIQDIDFEALARAKAQIPLDEQARATELAAQARVDTAARQAAADQRDRMRLVQEGRVLEQVDADRRAREAAAAAPPRAQEDVSLERLFEASRKQRIAAKQADQRAQPVAPPEPEPDRIVQPTDLLDMANEPVVQQAAPGAESASETLERFVDQLDDHQLRKILDAFEVKDRKRLKTSARLRQAVIDLEVDPADLRRIIEDK